MPWDRTIQFVLEVYSSYGKILLAGPADSSVRNDLPTLVLGDEMPVEVRFVERLADGTLALADPGATAEVILSARPAGAPSGSDLLCMAALTRASEAVWTGTLDLNTAEAAAHLIAAPAGAKTILMEAEVRSSGNTDRTSLQWDVILRPQVYENQDTPLALRSALGIFRVQKEDQPFFSVWEDFPDLEFDLPTAGVWELDGRYFIANAQNHDGVVQVRVDLNPATALRDLANDRSRSDLRVTHNDERFHMTDNLLVEFTENPDTGRVTGFIDISEPVNVKVYAVAVNAGIPSMAAGSWIRATFLTGAPAGSYYGEGAIGGGLL